MKITKTMLERARTDGGKVVKKPAPAKVTSIAPVAAAPKEDHTGELQALRGDISKLQDELEITRSAASTDAKELSGLIEALTNQEPMRLKPIRDMNPRSPTYLLVEYYDFIPVKYTRKLDS